MKRYIMKQCRDCSTIYGHEAFKSLETNKCKYCDCKKFRTLHDKRSVVKYAFVKEGEG